MTHSKDTVLVLMDATKDLVNQGAKAVKAVQSVDKLAPTQYNPLYWSSTNRSDVDAGSVILDENSYFICVRRK